MSVASLAPVLSVWKGDCAFAAFWLRSVTWDLVGVQVPRSFFVLGSSSCCTVGKRSEDLV